MMTERFSGSLFRVLKMWVLCFSFGDQYRIISCVKAVGGYFYDSLMCIQKSPMETSSGIGIHCRFPVSRPDCSVYLSNHIFFSNTLVSWIAVNDEGYCRSIVSYSDKDEDDGLIPF